MNLLAATDDGYSAVDLFNQFVCVTERCVKARLILRVPIRSAIVVVVIG